MIHIGIDPSINSLGMVIDDGNNKYFYIVKPNKLSKAEESCQHAYSNLNYVLYTKDVTKHEEYWEKERAKLYNMTNLVNKVTQIIDSFEGIKIIAIEGIAFGSKSNNLADLSGLNWLLRNALKEHNIYVYSPSSVKKFFTGNGNANKQLMVDVFLGIHPEFALLPKVDDLSDSYALMRMTKHLNVNDNNYQMLKI